VDVCVILYPVTLISSVAVNVVIGTTNEVDVSGITKAVTIGAAMTFLF
jgi:hypothetical protein